jgi:hypothetical protein
VTITPLTSLPPAPSTSDPTGFAARADALLGALPTFVEEQNAAIAGINGAVTSTSADAASASAAAAAVLAAPGTSATSATTASIGTGAKTLTIQTGKSLVKGMWIVAAATASPSTNQMTGSIDSYDPVTGILNFTVPSPFALGSGSYSSWTVSLTGKPADAATLAAAAAQAFVFALIF